MELKDIYKSLLVISKKCQDTKIQMQLSNLVVALGEEIQKLDQSSHSPHDTESVCMILETTDNSLEDQFTNCYPVRDRREAVIECMRLCTSEIIRLFDESYEYSMQIDGDSYIVVNNDKQTEIGFHITDIDYPSSI